jgi:GntR family transcriptional repressor for pyruvate dehydrogenase complex
MVEGRTDTTAVQDVARRIVQAYLEEQPPGSGRLPGERALAAHLHVSRATVREALRALEALGSIEKRKGSGTYVASRQLHESRFSPEMVLEARLALEPFLASLAAVRATAQEVEELFAMVHRAEEPGASFEEQDGQLHLEIARAARNDILTEFATVLHGARTNQLWGSLKQRVFARPGRVEEYQSQHRAILRAIHRRDAPAAMEEMRRHLETVRRDMLYGPG